MTGGMTAYRKRLFEKLAISLPSHVAENARRAVKRGKAASLSAYVAKAVEEQTKQDDLEALLDEMLAETGGPMTAAEWRSTRRLLGLDGRRTARRRKARR